MPVSGILKWLGVPTLDGVISFSICGPASTTYASGLHQSLAQMQLIAYRSWI
jgi:hypothetical protein